MKQHVELTRHLSSYVQSLKRGRVMKHEYVPGSLYAPSRWR